MKINEARHTRHRGIYRDGFNHEPKFQSHIVLVSMNQIDMPTTVERKQLMPAK